jgi:tRNA A-37 threonylcarbamoyl transferase component Bud32
MPLHVVCPIPDSGPSGLVTSRASRRALPPDVLKDASLRLGILSVVVAALWILGTVLGHVTLRVMGPGGAERWLSFGSTDIIAIASVALSIALFVYTRRTTRDPQDVLDLGLVYMVVMSLALGLMFHWDGAPHDWPINTQISWIGVMLLLTAAVVPTSIPKMLIAGTIAVSMNPVGMLIARATGAWEFGSAWNAVLMHYPDFLLVGVAAVISGVVTQLGRQVSKAREMGSYELTELLGRGGMGEVYKANHRMLARPAAIKLIRPEALGGQDSEAAHLAVRRFHREAEAAANLRSPHTVEIYDFGVTDDQTLYFVMELLDGMDLEALVKTHGPLPAARVIHILTQVCESLEEAHQAGLVHRDIKPANIHIGRLALQRDFVKVLDFGLVKPFEDKNAEQSMATIAGQTPGTPAYMAPEMALSEAVDGRSDIYALGCVAYYLLTAKLVFEADTAVQMIAKHLQNAPVLPSLRTDNHVPRALDKLVLRCLAKSPEDRPQTAAEVATALAGIDVLAWGAEEAERWWSTLANGAASPHILQS